MQAPDLTVSLSDGTLIPLRALYQDQPLAILIVRHLGCVFCMESVSEFRDQGADLNVVFVAMGSLNRVEEFRQRHRSPHRFIVDSTQALHTAFHARRASLAQFLSPRVIARGIQATAKGYISRPPVSDPRVLAAAVVVDQTGRARWTFYSRDAADNPSVAAVRAALEEARSDAVSATLD
jgi:hypothetical protein